ncbi:cell division protein PerM [Kitasatospora sp. NPDC003701]
MTQLMGRPILEVPGELGARPVLADVLTGVRTALLGLAAVAVPVLGLWVVTPFADDGAAGAVRLAGVLWLLGHGAPVLRGALDAPLTVTPLLLGLLAVGQLHRAGARAAARRRFRPRWSGPLAVWSGYCAVAVAVVAQCSGAGQFRARVLPDVLVVALLAGAATAAGARTARRVPERGRAADGPWPAPWPASWQVLRQRAVDRVPAWACPDGGAAAVRTAALAAGAGLVATGAAVVAVAAVLAAATGGGPGAAALAQGPAAGAGLLLLSVVLLPNAVLWGTAYALGPGFAAGAGTLVAPGGTVLGPLPELPLFALVAEPGAGGWRLLACLLPALAGVAPAVLLGRAAANGALGQAGPGRPDGSPKDRNDPDDPDNPDDLDGPYEPDAAAWHPAGTVVAALAVALLTGAAAAVLGWLSGGALAGGRMAELGPVPWRTGLAAAGWIAVVAVPGALLTRFRALGSGLGGGPGGAMGDDAGDAGLGGGVLTGHARRGVLLLRARAYAVVLRLGSSADGTAGADRANGPGGTD